jgi:hypothetical protein
MESYPEHSIRHTDFRDNLKYIYKSIAISFYCMSSEHLQFTPQTDFRLIPIPI